MLVRGPSAHTWVRAEAVTQGGTLGRRAPRGGGNCGRGSRRPLTRPPRGPLGQTHQRGSGEAPVLPPARGGGGRALSLRRGPGCPARRGRARRLVLRLRSPGCGSLSRAPAAFCTLASGCALRDGRAVAASLSGMARGVSRRLPGGAPLAWSCTRDVSSDFPFVKDSLGGSAKQQ